MTLNIKKSESDWLVCECGNEPHIDGFYPCLKNGIPVEPVIGGLWKGNLYVCGKCYTVYDADTFDEIGVASLEAIVILESGCFLR